MKIGWKSCIRIAVTAFAVFLATTYWSGAVKLCKALISAATPLIIGCVAAYIINILMSFYEKYLFPKKMKSPAMLKLKRVISIVLAIVSLLGVASLIFGLVIPELISCIKFILSEIPPTVEKLLNSNFVKKTLPADILAEFSGINWQEHITNIAQVVVSGIGGATGLILNTVTSVFSGLVTALISIIITIYILIDRDNLKRQCINLFNTYLPKKVNSRLFYILNILNKSFRRYIVGQCTEAVILGVLCTIGMLIFKFPYAGMVGALIGFTALIPIAGAYIGAAVGALMILTQSPLKALGFLIFIIALQQIEGNLIYPKVVGKSIGLPALWVLVAVTVGGSLAGILGMLVGVPITSALYRIVKDDMHRRRSACDSEETEKAESQ